MKNQKIRLYGIKIESKTSFGGLNEPPSGDSKTSFGGLNEVKLRYLCLRHCPELRGAEKEAGKVARDQLRNQIR